MEKAIIKTAQGETPAVTVQCLFNPTEYTFRKTNDWNAPKTVGTDLPDIQFTGGNAASLTMQLFLDTSVTGGDVRDTVNKIHNLMKINPNATGHGTATQGRPPFVEFQWGQTWSFKAVITNLQERYTLFREDGVPVRATLDITFLQGERTDEAQTRAQNPTTMGRQGYRQWVVSEGDTIDWIAFSEYGDASKWRYIADINNLDEPDRLKPGQALAIAPLP